MSLETFRLHERPPVIRQRGLAMIMIVVLLALVSAYFIAYGLNRTGVEVSGEREQRSQNVLQQAKAALVAYAASSAWSSGATDQPGALPCPDRKLPTDLLAGQQESNCDSDAVRIGRLPWKTLNVSDLRDPSGEQLWFVLSGNFRKKSGTTVINSDTQGQLGIGGSTSVNRVVALVIAPGPALSTQNRDKTNLALLNDPSNYLEGANATAVTNPNPLLLNVFETRVAPADRTAAGDLIFNDKVLAITEADLFSTVEPTVAARIERDIKPYIVTYFQQWGAYPFPVPFNDPTITDAAVNPVSPYNVGPGNASDRGQALYVGSAAAGFGGLLPVTASATYPLNGGTSSVTLTGGTAGWISNVSCSTIVAPTSGFSCDFTLNSLNSPFVCGSFFNSYCIVNPSFRVAGDIANVGMSFANMADSDVTVTNWGTTTRAMSATTLTRTLSSAGTATVTFQGTHAWSRYNSSSFSRNMRVKFPVIASALTGSADPNAGWFISNQWYRQVYYAVSPGYLPGGGGACTVRPTPPGAPASNSCLMVNNLPSPRYSTLNDKRAILLLMGRSLNGSARPSPTLGNYLEGSNLTALSSPQYVFEHRAGAASSINDRVVVVCPDTALCP